MGQWSQHFLGLEHRRKAGRERVGRCCCRMFGASSSLNVIFAESLASSAQAACRMPGMPLAMRARISSWRNPGDRDHRSLRALGVLPGREFSYPSLLAGLGKGACQKRRLFCLRDDRAHVARQQNVSGNKSIGHGLRMHTARREYPAAFGWRYAQALEPFHQRRGHSPVHELLAVERKFHQRYSS